MSSPEVWNVGGQAVIEGVMMRSPRCLAVAVRRANGEIVIKEDRWVSVWEKLRFLRWPFFRGGVVFFEALHNGIKALSFSAAQAGLESEEGEAEPSSGEMSKMAVTLTIAFSLVVGFAVFAALPHFVTWLTGLWLGSDALQSGTSVSFHLVDGAIKIAVFVAYLALISRMPDIRRVFQYHGAEHKSIYCYENGEDLTVENARRYTTFHPRCGTSFVLIVLLISIVMFSIVFPLLPVPTGSAVLNQVIYVFIKIPLMFPVAGVAYELVRMSGRHANHPLVRVLTWPGLMLQRITTKEPTDAQLEIALVALQKALWRERVGAAEKVATIDEEGLEVYPSYADFATTVQQAA